MAKRIFVGNLPFSATEEQLRGLFSAHGEVASVHIITDKFTGRPRGFAFVEMNDDAAATAAIAAVNQQQLDGRALTVNEARERSEGARGGAGSGRPAGPRRGRDQQRDYNRPRW